MNEAQRLELQQIRDEQTLLSDRLARLESRLLSLEETGVEAPAVPPALATQMPLPPPMSPPSVPIAFPLAAVPPPMPPEADTAPPLPAAAWSMPASADTPAPFVFPQTPPPRGSTPPPAPAAAKESLEVRIGTTWFVRVGVVMVLTALAFLGSYLYTHVVPHLGPVAKVGLMYLGAGALAGVGAWLERGKEAARSPRMLNFARVVLAGGLAAVYYVTYAAHWNPNLLVLHSAFLDGVLLLGWTAFMVWLAERRASEVLATFAILLAYYTSAVNEIAAFTLFSNLALTVAAIFLLRRHLWRVFPYASLLATFGSYGFWRYYYGYQAWAHPEQSPQPTDRFWIEAIFLLIYWLLFTGSVFAPGASSWTPRRRAGFATLNNGAFFALITWILHWRYHGAFWMWSLGFGVALCLLAEACRWVRPRVDSETEGSYFVQGIVLVTLGLLAYLDGWQLSLMLAAQSVVLLGRAQLREERLPLWGAMASAVAAFMVAAGQLGDWHASLPWPSAAGAGALLVFNAWWSQYRLEKSSGAQNPNTTGLPSNFATLTVAPAFFAALGLAVWLWLIERTLWQAAALVPTLAAAAAVLTGSVYVLRVRAVPFYALTFLLAAYLHRFAADDLANEFSNGLPAWGTLGLFAGTLALGHWWQRRWPWIEDRLRPPQEIGSLLAASIAVLAVMLLYDWTRPDIKLGPAADVWVAEIALLSLALLVYGIRTRYRSLAIAGQALLYTSIVGCEVRIGLFIPSGGSVGQMTLTFVPVVVLLATIFAGRRYSSGGLIVPLLVIYEVVATFFFIGWGCQYVPAEARFTFFSIAGVLLAVWTQVRREPRWLWWSNTLTFVGVVALVVLHEDERAAFLQLIGIAAIAGQQQFARFWVRSHPAAGCAVPPRWQGAWIITATLCAWTVLNARMTLSFGATFTLAAAWSLFAALVFAAGLFLRERVYRWMGLAILVCTLARIGLVDIWQLDGLGRTISALCLGLVFLGVGYLYNRFQARWHGLF